jgi:hypothetical protein
VPDFLNGSFGGMLRDELGICQVEVLRHGRTVKLRRGVRATCYINVTDSILVIEDGDRVLVDANDALHASSPATIDYFCRLLRRNHPSIDTLYLGYSGASWFPNCLRLPGKHDRAVARAREELFADNFVRVVEALRPRIACAFAASFVLVDPALRWINEVKMSVETPDQLYRRAHPEGGTRVHLLLPNDVVDDVDIISGATPRPSPAELTKAFETTLQTAVERAEHLTPLTHDQLKGLVQRVDSRVRAHASRANPKRPFSVEIRLRDNPGVALDIDFDRSGARAALGVPRSTHASIELRAEILEAALRDDYGVESVVIGYGAIATLNRPEELATVQTLLAMLTPRQSTWQSLAGEIRQHPLHAAATAWRQRVPLALSLGTRLGVIPHPYELRNLSASPDDGERQQAA